MRSGQAPIRLPRLQVLAPHHCLNSCLLTTPNVHNRFPQFARLVYPTPALTPVLTPAPTQAFNFSVQFQCHSIPAFNSSVQFRRQFSEDSISAPNPAFTLVFTSSALNSFTTGSLSSAQLVPFHSAVYLFNSNITSTRFGHFEHSPERLVYFKDSLPRRD